MKIHTWLFVLAVFLQKVYVQKRYFKRREPALVRSSLEFAVVKGHDTQGRYNTQHPICWRPRIPPASQLKVLLHPSETSHNQLVFRLLFHIFPILHQVSAWGWKLCCHFLHSAIQFSTLYSAPSTPLPSVEGGGWGAGAGMEAEQKSLRWNVRASWTGSYQGKETYLLPHVQSAFGVVAGDCRQVLYRGTIPSGPIGLSLRHLIVGFSFAF